MAALPRAAQGRSVRGVDPGDPTSVTEINLKTLPEHCSDCFYESRLAELPGAFLLAESGGRAVG